MTTLTQEQANTAWAQFASIFTNVGLNEYYNMDELREELLVSPCAINDEFGTAYKGALLMHINITTALAQRIAKMISGTFPIEDETIFKICSIMHLSKRHLYVENDNEWEIKNRGLNFKFKKGIEGCLKGGERSALEALNNGVKLTPTEYEAIKALDDDNTNANAYKNILTTVIKQANELAFAIEKERYNKIVNNK